MNSRIRIGLSVAAGALALAVLAGPAAAQGTAVTVVDFGGAWQEAQRKAVWDPAFKKLGFTLKEDSLQTIADVRLQVQSGRPAWDVVSLPHGECVAAEKENLFEPIDYSQVPNAKDMEPGVNGRTYTGGTVWAAFVIAWSKKKYGDNGPQNWADFFDTQKFPGKRAAYDAPRFMIEAALMADGVAKEKVYPADLDRAYAKLKASRKDISIWYKSFGQAVQLIKNDEVDMIPLLDGRVIDVIKDGANWGFTFNQGIINGACLAVVRGSRNQAAAMKVINEFLDPAIQANIPKFFSYGPMNAKAFATGIIAADVAKRLNSAPDNMKQLLLLDSNWWGNNRQAAQIRWDEFSKN
jgi:putative spermidine/putrescine transport system substrate-binding protein